MSGFAIERNAIATLGKLKGGILPKDLVAWVLSYLDIQSLANSSLVCKYWQQIFLSNVVWKKHLENILDKLVHIPHCSSAQQLCIEKFKAVKADIKRKQITLEELTQFTWSFRFKKAAGANWINIDPYWDGKECMKVKFYQLIIARVLDFTGYPRRLIKAWELREVIL